MHARTNTYTHIQCVRERECVCVCVREKGRPHCTRCCNRYCSTSAVRAARQSPWCSRNSTSASFLSICSRPRQCRYRRGQEHIHTHTCYYHDDDLEHALLKQNTQFYEKDASTHTCIYVYMYMIACVTQTFPHIPQTRPRVCPHPLAPPSLSRVPFASLHALYRRLSSSH